MYESLDSDLAENLLLWKEPEAWLHVHRGRRVWSVQFFCAFSGPILAYAAVV